MNYSWKKNLSQSITDPNQLFQLLQLNTDIHHDLLAYIIDETKDFPLRVPLHFIKKIQKNNLNDPLLKQILPSPEEKKNVPGYILDPLKEKISNPLPGLLHKYKGRVLIILTKACAIHCRYCFRKHFNYSTNVLNRAEWKKIFSYIQKDPSIHEVILSGGDPLTMDDTSLKSFCSPLSQINHLKRLRIHTRVPIALPQRITSDLIAWFSQLSLQPIIVIHVNHPKEINALVKKALLKFKRKKILLLNQSVLLQGINDDIDTLVLLSETLFNAGVLPYYLHVLDKVKGAAHFDIGYKKAKRLHTDLNNQLPGYLVPKLVCEKPYKGAKVLL